MNAMLAAMAPGCLTTALRPELAVISRLIEAAKMGKTPNVNRMAPRLVTKLLADASVMKNGGMVMNNNNMLAPRREPDQIGCLAVMGMTW